ncbi:sugar kinase [Spirochaeta lutea]|uniref:2-dehydro-3-deoxygluconokinase n=1 Tax=Spirochaeta lutea TaxID=1480694 RepID=A0A098QYP0_9SPIO|nr:sugar kinase [Spirochaeta lutea]KGE72779.1 2-dehydro-3-deoxygluconokinase [Spirochaeta lutea]
MNTKEKRVVTLGEIMLRLKSPGHERFFQSPALEASFGGGESNVAVSLSILGIPSRFVSVVPDHDIGTAALGELQRFGVDVSFVRRGPGRLGIYFLETGANQRPSKVIYDREETGISRVRPGDFEWEDIFRDARWFHITGITPALSQSAADTALEAVQQASQRGVPVSIDLNFRKKLWNYGKSAPEVMAGITQYADVVIANEEDIQLCLGISAQGLDVTQGHLDAAVYEDLAGRVKQAYPGVKTVAITMRQSISADKNGWSAALAGPEGFTVSRKYAIDDIIDRVGGGDSFSAGLIFGLLEFPGDQERVINFAVAASALKHSIPGDFNLAQRQEVETLAGGDGSGRVQR